MVLENASYSLRVCTSPLCPGCLSLRLPPPWWDVVVDGFLELWFLVLSPCKQRLPATPCYPSHLYCLYPVLPQVVGVMDSRQGKVVLQVFSFVFLLVMATASPRLPHLFAKSLPLLPGLTTMGTKYSGQNVASVSPILQAAIQGRQPVSSTTTSQLGPQWVPDYIWCSHLCSYHFQPPLLISICPSSKVLMPGSRRCVCLLSRRSFVEL